MFDERQICPTVQAYIAGDIDGSPPDREACDHYNGGECLRAPGRVCAFLEDDSARVWRLARTWRPELRNGETVYVLEEAGR